MWGAARPAPRRCAVQEARGRKLPRGAGGAAAERAGRGRAGTGTPGGSEVTRFGSCPCATWTKPTRTGFQGGREPGRTRARGWRVAQRSCEWRQRGFPGGPQSPAVTPACPPPAVEDTCVPLMSSRACESHSLGVLATFRRPPGIRHPTSCRRATPRQMSWLSCL